MKFCKVFLLLLIIISASIWLESLIECEILTKSYTDDNITRMCKEYINTNDDIDVKVLHKGNQYRELYVKEYCENGLVAGHVIELIQDSYSSEEWRVLSWDTVFVSRGHGNATGFVWPYIFDTFKSLIQ